MAEEKKDEGARDPIKIFLKEALKKKGMQWWINFLRSFNNWPTYNASTSNSHSGGATPFKVQVKFDIIVFEGQIDADVVDRWFNLLEGYFSIHDFSDQ